LDVAAMNGNHDLLRAKIRVPMLVVAGVLGVLFFLGVSSDPTPVTGAPFTCRISKTFTMPTMDELLEIYDTPPIPSGYTFLAGVDARCLRNLVKGTYVGRMKATVSTQLATGWPEDIAEYPQGQDATFSLLPVYTAPSGPGERGLNDLGGSMVTSSPESLRVIGWGPGSLHGYGVAYSQLTELCVGERCTFESEQSGIYFEPTGIGDYGVMLLIEDTCQRIVPIADDLTIMCRDVSEYGPASYFHPGLSGARFTVSAELYFEPLMTWRR